MTRYVRGLRRCFDVAANSFFFSMVVYVFHLETENYVSLLLIPTICVLLFK